MQSYKQSKHVIIGLNLHWMGKASDPSIGRHLTLAGVEVTHVINQPALCHSKKLNSKDTAYVKPKASQTAINNLQQ